MIPAPATPDELRTAADEVRGASAFLRDALEPVTVRCRDDVWSGRKATRFRDALEDERRRLGAVADHLDLVAHRLDLRAAEAALAGPATADPIPWGA
jgi:hypothetical protein